MYTAKLQVGLQKLENKSLLLLISSSLDIEDYLLKMVLRDVQWETKIRVLWIPMLDNPTTKNMRKQYRGLAEKGKLLSMRNLQKSKAPGLARFVKEKFFPTFQIGGEPIIVSLDHRGRIVHSNAMHMILIRARGVLYTNYTQASRRDSITPLLQDVLKERTLHVREFVPDIDTMISDFAGEMNSRMNGWLRKMDKYVQNPVRFF